MPLGKRLLVGLLLRIFVVIVGFEPLSKGTIAPKETVIEYTNTEDNALDGEEIVVTSGSIYVDTTSAIRPQIIQGLISYGFTGWNTQPFSGSNANGVITYQGTGFTIRNMVQGTDSIDKWIEALEIQQDSENTILPDEAWIDKGSRSSRQDLYLFKSQEDLEQLGYEVISSRRRISTDVAYRRKNIQQSFSLIGNVRVIPPSGNMIFMDAAQYDGITKENYEYGYVVIGNQEKLDYGGGICGASSAIYQGIVNNGSLQTPGVRNHTRRYGYLYDAYIDGELVTTPGIDSAVFDGSLDLEMENTASHPIVLVMNYDGTIGGVEEVFTIGRASDRQEIEFLSSYPITYTGPSGIGTGTITTRGGCYTWLIGDEEVRRCYRKVSE